MDMPKEFYDMVCADIKRLDNVRNLSAGELFELHRQIDARYQACINKWCDGLWCSTNDGTHIAYGHLAQNPQLMQGIKLASTSGVMVCGALQMMEHISLMDIWPRILKSMCYLI